MVKIMKIKNKKIVYIVAGIALIAICGVFLKIMGPSMTGAAVVTTEDLKIVGKAAGLIVAFAIAVIIALGYFVRMGE